MMQLNYVGKKTTVRDSFKEMAEKKLQKLDKFFDDNPQVTVIVTNENEMETVEVTIKSRGIFFRAEKAGEDRQNALDQVVDVLHNQIVRNKSRLQKRYKGAAAPFAQLPDEPKEEAAHTLVKTKRFPVGVMDTDEAILQMDLLGHSFFMFRNGETGEINVVYRRNDGNYGLLEPVAD